MSTFILLSEASTDWSRHLQLNPSSITTSKMLMVSAGYYM